MKFIINNTAYEGLNLEELLKKSCELYDKMTDEEKAEMHRKQKRSWIRGELMLSESSLTEEQANQRIDRHLPELKDN